MLLFCLLQVVSSWSGVGGNAQRTSFVDDVLNVNGRLSARQLWTVRTSAPYSSVWRPAISGGAVFFSLYAPIGTGECKVVALSALSGTTLKTWASGFDGVVTDCGPVSIVENLVIMQVTATPDDLVFTTTIVALSLDLDMVWATPLPSSGFPHPYGVVGTKYMFYCILSINSYTLLCALDLITGNVLSYAVLGVSSSIALTMSRDSELVYYSAPCGIGAVNAFDLYSTAWNESESCMPGTWYPVATNGAALSSLRDAKSVWYRISNGGLMETWEHSCSYEGSGQPAVDADYVYAPCTGGITLYSLEHNAAVGEFECDDCNSSPVVLRDYVLTVSQSRGLLVFRKPHFRVSRQPILQMQVLEEPEANIATYGALAYNDSCVYIPYRTSDGGNGLTTVRLGDFRPTLAPTSTPTPEPSTPAPSTSSPTVKPTSVPSTPSDDSLADINLPALLCVVVLVCFCIFLCTTCRLCCRLRRPRPDNARPPVVQATYAVTSLSATTFLESPPSSDEAAAIELPSSRNNGLPADTDQPAKDDELMADDDDVPHSYVRLVAGDDNDLANNKGAP